MQEKLDNLLKHLNEDLNKKFAPKKLNEKMDISAIFGELDRIYKEYKESGGKKSKEEFLKTPMNNLLKKGIKSGADLANLENGNEDQVAKYNASTEK
jgi:hypothetical protein